MSYYRGFAFKFNVSREAPPEIVNFLDILLRLYDDSADWDAYEKFTERNEARLPYNTLQDIKHMLVGVSAHFDSWHWASKEDRHSSILYETRSGSNSIEIELARLFLSFLKEHLVLTEGDILVRSLGEREQQEMIIAVVDGELQIRRGYRYLPEEYDTIIDLRDPRVYKRETVVVEETDAYGQKWHVKKFDGDHFIPPWNVKQLEELMAKEAQERSNLNSVK